MQNTTKTIDCHCHIQDEKYKNNFCKFAEELKQKCLFVIVSGANKKWNREAIELSKKYPKLIYSTIGIHPIDATKMTENDFEDELKFIQNNKKNIVGIGEIGLDYHWEKDKKIQELQKRRFEQLLCLAIKIKKPVVIHSWDAEEDAINILKKYNLKNTIKHCFSGKRVEMQKAISLGYYISFSTNVLFSKQLRKLAKNCPIENMLIETDAPYMDPNHTGKNMPWNTYLSIKKIAEFKKLSPEFLLNKIIDDI